MVRKIAVYPFTPHSTYTHPSLQVKNLQTLKMAGNLINTNSQSVPIGQPVRTLRTQSSLTTVRVWRCNRSLRNNDEQEAAFL